MSKTGAQLVTAVKQRAARTNDTVLITTDFVLDALNEAQIKITRETPRIVDLDASDTTTYTISTNDTSVNISTLDPAHIGGIWILNGADTRQQGLKYRELSRFRSRYIPIANQSSTEPTEYTRQGNTIYFDAPVSSDYNGLNLHIDYTAWPTDLANGAVASEITRADKGLILFALAECYDAMALSQPQFEAKALKTRGLFNIWFDEYKDYQMMLIEELANAESN
jgi:hypothetical protein